MAVVRHEGRQARPGLAWICRVLMEGCRLQNDEGTEPVNLFVKRYRYCSLVSCPREEGREPPRELSAILKCVKPVSPPTDEERVPVSLL